MDCRDDYVWSANVVSGWARGADVAGWEGASMSVEEARWATQNDPNGEGARLERQLRQHLHEQQEHQRRQAEILAAREPQGQQPPQQQQQHPQHQHQQQSPDRGRRGAASSADSQTAACALEEVRNRCSSFLGDLEALARRVRPDRAGPVLEECLTECQWDALDALDEAVSRAMELDVPVDDAVWSLPETARTQRRGRRLHWLRHPDFLGPGPLPR
jgi:hypothetical protein